MKRIKVTPSASMLKGFKVNLKKRVIDDALAKFDDIDETLVDPETQEELKEWVETFIVPILELSGAEVSVDAESQSIDITVDDISPVKDSLKKVLVRKKLESLLRIKDDDDEPEPEPEPIEEVNVDNVGWISNYAAPSIEAFLQDHGIEADVTVDEQGTVTIVPELEEDVEFVDDIIDSYVHPKLKGKLRRVKDAEDDPEPKPEDDPEPNPEPKPEDDPEPNPEPNPDEPTTEEWLNDVVIPALEDKLQEEGLENVTSVVTAGDVVSVQFSIENSDENLDNIYDSVKPLIQGFRPNGKGKAKITMVKGDKKIRVTL